MEHELAQLDVQELELNARRFAGRLRQTAGPREKAEAQLAQRTSRRMRRSCSFGICVRCS